MEHHNIYELLNDSTVSKSMARKWIEVNGLPGGVYSVNKNVRFKTSILRWNLCDYHDAYIAVKGTVDLLTATGNKNDKPEKKVAFKNNATFRLFI